MIYANLQSKCDNRKVLKRLCSKWTTF